MSNRQTCSCAASTQTACRRSAWQTLAALGPRGRGAALQARRCTRRQSASTAWAASKATVREGEPGCGREMSAPARPPLVGRRSNPTMDPAPTTAVPPPLQSGAQASCCSTSSRAASRSVQVGSGAIRGATRAYLPPQPATTHRRFPMPMSHLSPHAYPLRLCRIHSTRSAKEVG